MKPQAYEALQKAKALFRHPAEVVHDDIPEQVTQAPEPIRKPRVVLLPPNAPKFDAKTIEEENKKMEKQKQDLAQAMAKQKQTDKYVEMSVTQACEACLRKGIKKPSAIAQETGKKVEQIYTALWKIKQNKAKAKRETKEAKRYEFDVNQPTPEFVMPKSLDKIKAEFEREPLAWEDRSYVVLKTREQYEEAIMKLQTDLDYHRNQLNRMKIVVEYLEGKVNG